MDPLCNTQDGTDPRGLNEIAELANCFLGRSSPLLLIPPDALCPCGQSFWMFKGLTSELSVSSLKQPMHFPTHTATNISFLVLLYCCFSGLSFPLDYKTHKKEMYYSHSPLCPWNLTDALRWYLVNVWGKWMNRSDSSWNWVLGDFLFSPSSQMIQLNTQLSWIICQVSEQPTWAAATPLHTLLSTACRSTEDGQRCVMRKILSRQVSGLPLPP